MSDALRQGQQFPPRAFGPFAAAAVAAYAAASGDNNPLHTDPALAARAGLARPPIHGMLVMGCMAPYLRALLPGARVVKISAKFIRPVLVDEPFEIGGKVVSLSATAAPSIIRLTAKRGSELVCLAEAFVAAG